ncbi:MAG TPA: hypothetical protein VL793_08885 [Patescibacteria group bacterium]|nr:hypothetical protein [Patescibacteria group bacterium]
MKRSIAILSVSAMIAWFCWAQDSYRAEAAKPAAGAGGGKTELPNTDPAGNYVALGGRTIALKAQSDLLDQLSQEHRKRAKQMPPDQVARIQWEMDLAKELGDRSATVLGEFNNVRKERLSLEQSHPELASLAQSAVAAMSSGGSGGNAEELAFTTKLEERLASVQQEIADAIDAGRLYAAQLHTNTASLEFSRISSLLQDNNSAVRQLQKEASDLELKKLEFRALRRE